MNKPLQVCILWHMHQPDYRDPISGQTLLPWTWLHGLKDYGEMLETIAETGARVTVNLVPTLLEQLERYANNSDQDRWLQLAAKPPSQLNADERLFIVRHFFSVNEETQILPNLRYHQLFNLRGGDPEASVASFSNQDLLDLQVWFLLAWTGFHLRRKSSFVSGLLRQAENFSEADKTQLLKICHAEVGRVIALHQKLEKSGQAELSVTPYAHPILPLLCDLRTAREPSPDLQLPAADFRHPEDARLQVREGLMTANRVLGSRRRGMWPAEGAVCPASVALLQEEGALWAATDEDILARSLSGGLKNRRKLYKIYQFAGLPLFFRDRELSDRIGFLYATWEPEEAVKDIQTRLHRIAHLAPAGVVAIILDGENCWERFQDNGYPFLKSLYETLQADPLLQLATFQEAIDQCPAENLDRLASGSWIRSDFTTWIGHPEENLAWEQLQKSRHETIRDEISQALAHPEEPLSELVRELLRAEGSDWFWWFGDEHVTAQADIFDRLYRLHLEALYHLKQIPVPQRLHHWIKPPVRITEGLEPSARFTPTIDGQVGDYFEWLAAGRIELAAGGAMYSSRETLQEIFFGYDADYLYFRLDQPDLLQALCGKSGSFEIRLSGRQLIRLSYKFSDQSLSILANNKKIAKGKGACRTVIELAAPLAALNLEPGDQLNLSCHTLQGNKENGRWPAEGSARFCFQGSHLDDNWSV